MESLVGQRLGAYHLEAEIGRGSMGIVYRGYHMEQGHPAAIKVLLEALATDDSFVTRFTREAHIVHNLQHPNIVRLYEAGRDRGRIYFAMEYFSGDTAGHLIKQRGRLPVGQVVEIAAQAADALAYAHTHGHLVHRDIKPENLLVDRWCRVKVLDFGLARVDGLESITRAGTVVGSLYYVSAEQVLGRTVDGRADVYALGVSMYEMLTGQRPFRGRTLTEMTDAILSGKAIPPSQLEPGVSPALEAIVLRAMARDLDHRYASAAQLHADLRTLQMRMTGAPASDQQVAAPDGADLPTTPLRLTLGFRPDAAHPGK
ncbi:MAG TPA: serine/threonine-protein kinase [Ktedonobacterales bacterium]